LDTHSDLEAIIAEHLAKDPNTKPLLSFPQFIHEHGLGRGKYRMRSEVLYYLYFQWCKVKGIKANKSKRFTLGLDTTRYLKRKADDGFFWVFLNRKFILKKSIRWILSWYDRKVTLENLKRPKKRKVRPKRVWAVEERREYERVRKAKWRQKVKLRQLDDQGINHEEMALNILDLKEDSSPV